MAYGLFDPRAQLRHRPGVAVRNKKRVIAESSPPRRPRSDGTTALGLKGPDEPAAGGQGHTTDEPGAAFGSRNMRHRVKKLCVIRRVILDRPSKPGRADAGTTPECIHLQPGIFRQNEQDRMPGYGERFLDGIHQEGAAVFRNRWDVGKTVQSEEPHRKAGTKLAKFPDLVPVPGGAEKRDRHCEEATGRRSNLVFEPRVLRFAARNDNITEGYLSAPPAGWQ